jgi:hypothetical protein
MRHHNMILRHQHHIIILTSLECRELSRDSCFAIDVSISRSYDFYLSYLLDSVLQTWYVLTLPLPKTDLSYPQFYWNGDIESQSLDCLISERLVGQHFRTASPHPTMLYGQSEARKSQKYPLVDKSQTSLWSSSSH